MILILIIVAIILHQLYKYYSRNVNFWIERGVNGPKPLPLFGNMLDNFKTPINILEMERIRKYGKVYGYLEMSQPVLTVADNELIKLITVKDFDCFTNHSNQFSGDPFMSKSIISLEDNSWKRVRNISSSAFSVSKIKNMFDLVDRCVDNLIDFCNKNADDEKLVDTKKTGMSFAIDTIACVSFGIETNSFKNDKGEFLKHAFSVVDFHQIRPIIGYLLPDTIKVLTGFSVTNPEATEYFKEVMKHIIKERQNIGSEHKDLVKTLITAELQESGLNSPSIVSSFNFSPVLHKLTEEEIVAQCTFILLAAFETTATVFNYLMYSLAMHPEIQSKLFIEVKEMFEKNEYNYDVITSLPYLDAVINETLRMYPPIVHFDRVTKYDYKLGDTGITIPKGTLINIPYYAIHHDSEYWNEPYKFKPERFFPENKDNIKPYTFIPFGVGPRMCLGWKLAVVELKMAISRLVYHFEILKTEKTPEKPIYNSKKILLLCEDIFVLLKLRNKK